MRVGQNPAKFVKSVAQPADVTVTLVSCIPFIGGFYEQSLNILRESIYSIHNNTERPFDLMVFDNHSCREVRAFFTETYEQGIIQYLILSDTNIGKIGAWNFMFGAAQGKYIAFSDSDIYFRPGWLKASLELFESFPNVGMVTGRPMRTPEEFSSATLEWGRRQDVPGLLFEEGTFLDWDTFYEHTKSLGHSEADAKSDYNSGKDYRVSYDNKYAFVGANHFQFLTKKEILEEIFPLTSEKPMRGERSFDIAINELGYLRLSTCTPLVLHMGNQLTETGGERPKHLKKSWLISLLWIPVIRRILLRIYGIIFHIYFNYVD